MLIVFYIFGQFFRGLKFHESIKSAKFAEFKYLEKTNYTVIAKPFKFSVLPTPHVRKLEARANRKFHAAKSFGGIGYFNAL